MDGAGELGEDVPGDGDVLVGGAQEEPDRRGGHGGVREPDPDGDEEDGEREGEPVAYLFEDGVPQGRREAEPKARHARPRRGRV